jgi:hypothetical protein
VRNAGGGRRSQTGTSGSALSLKTDRTQESREDEREERRPSRGDRFFRFLGAPPEHRRAGRSFEPAVIWTVIHAGRSGQGPLEIHLIEDLHDPDHFPGGDHSVK